MFSSLKIALATSVGFLNPPQNEDKEHLCWIFLQVAFFKQIQYFRQSPCFDVFTQSLQILLAEFHKKLKWQQVNAIWFNIMEGSIWWPNYTNWLHKLYCSQSCLSPVCSRWRSAVGEGKKYFQNALQLEDRLKLTVFMLRSNCKHFPLPGLNPAWDKEDKR